MVQPTRRREWRVVVAALVVAWAGSAFAQTVAATVRGTVTDPTGGAIPAAKATLINLDTGDQRRTTTNGSGGYVFAEAPVGAYDLFIEADGFRPYVQRGVRLGVAEHRSIDARLQTGDVIETITVEAPLVFVDRTGGEVNGVVTGEQMRELPLNGRNFSHLVQLMPGVATLEGTSAQNKGALAGSIDLAVSGGGVTGNLWLIDGVYNNDTGSNRSIMVYPSVDAIAEMKVHRNSYGAEFGGAGGAQVNVATRGGSDDFHGSAFYFGRDEALGADNYFLRSAGRKEPLQRHDFGWNLGGPIRRGKLHFFASQEWNRERRGVLRSGLVPTAEERRGSFGGPRIPGCTPPRPLDPLTGRPFPGDAIPDSRLSPGGLLLLQLYPLPNTVPGAGGCTNWVDSLPTRITWRQDNVRLDYSLDERTRLMVRATQDGWANSAPNATSANGLWGDDPFPAVESAWKQPGRSMIAQLTRSIGSRAINTLRLAYSANRFDIEPEGQDPELGKAINDAIPPLFPPEVKRGGPDRAHAVFWGGQGYGPLSTIAPWHNVHDVMAVGDDYSQLFRPAPAEGRRPPHPRSQGRGHRRRLRLRGAPVRRRRRPWGPGRRHHRQRARRLAARGHDLHLFRELDPAPLAYPLDGLRPLRHRLVAHPLPPVRRSGAPVFTPLPASRGRRPHLRLRARGLRSGPARRRVQRCDAASELDRLPRGGLRGRDVRRRPRPARPRSPPGRAAARDGLGRLRHGTDGPAHGPGTLLPA